MANQPLPVEDFLGGGSAVEVSETQKMGKHWGNKMLFEVFVEVFANDSCKNWVKNGMKKGV